MNARPGQPAQTARMDKDKPRLMIDAGIKEYSEWPTIPQLYVNKEFVGGTDIMMSMHQDGSLAKLLEEQDVLVPAEGESDGSSSS